MRAHDLTSHVHTAGDVASAARPKSRLRSYLRFGKLDIDEHYFDIFVVSTAVLLPDTEGVVRSDALAASRVLDRHGSTSTRVPVRAAT